MKKTKQAVKPPTRLQRFKTGLKNFLDRPLSSQFQVYTPFIFAVVGIWANHNHNQSLWAFCFGGQIGGVIYMLLTLRERMDELHTNFMEWLNQHMEMTSAKLEAIRYKHLYETLKDTLNDGTQTPTTTDTQPVHSGDEPEQVVGGGHQAGHDVPRVARSKKSAQTT